MSVIFCLLKKLKNKCIKLIWCIPIGSKLLSPIPAVLLFLFFFAENQARQKWKSLRDTYRNVLAKEISSRALKVNVLYQPTWPQYEKLHFLKEQFKYDCLSEETITEIRHTPSSNCETRTLSNIDGVSSLKNKNTGKKRNEMLITEIDQNQLAKKPCQSVKLHHDHCQRGSQTEILLDLIEEQNKSIMRYKKEVDQLKLLLDQMKNILNNLSENLDFPSSQSLLSVLKEKQLISLPNQTQVINYAKLINSN